MKQKLWNNYWKKYSSLGLKRVYFFVIIVVLIGAFSAYYSQPKPLQKNTQPAAQSQVTPQTETTIPKPAIAKGSLIIVAKDVAQKLKSVGLGEATELFITIKSVQVNKQIDPLENRAVLADVWTTLFSGDKGFDLLQYTDKTAFIAEKEVDAANYSQIRLYISGATMKINNPEFQISNKTYTMYFSNNAFKITRPFSVEENKTTVLKLDFDIPALVTRTSQGYTFGPLFKDVTNEITVNESMIALGTRPADTVDVQ